MAGTVRTEIRGLPAEIVVQIMACMPSPIALLDFLTAFTSVIELFEKFHSEILDQVLIIEAPPMVQKMIAEGGKPVSYEFARACSQDAERWNAPALKVPSLRKPHLTLMTIVLDCATGPETKEAKSLRKELEAMGADMNLCYEYTRYWKFRLVHEEAVAVVSPHSFCISCVVAKSLPSLDPIGSLCKGGISLS